MTTAPLEIPENGSIVKTLTSSQLDALRACKFVDVSPARTGANEWQLTGRRGWVGVFKAGDRIVRLDPKLTISRVLFLAGYARPGQWYDEAVEATSAEGLVPVVANSLWRLAHTAFRAGILRGYQEVTETTTTLRGRLRPTDQFRKHYDQALPVEVSYDDYTVDIPENQIALAAITRMLTLPDLDSRSAHQLEALRKRLTDVSPLRLAAPRPRWQATRLNEHYHSLLGLCEFLLDTWSPELGQGSAPVNGFVFNLEKVFEDFVTNALIEALSRRVSGSGKPQHLWYLDDERTIEMHPDLVWLDGDIPVTVIDAKYSERHKNDNLYQLLTYCAALDVSSGHLVYAKGKDEVNQLRAGKIDLYRHSLDLTADRNDLLAQIDRIAERIAGAPRRTS